MNGKEFVRCVRPKDLWNLLKDNSVSMRNKVQRLVCSSECLVNKSRCDYFHDPVICKFCR